MSASRPRKDTGSPLARTEVPEFEDVVQRTFEILVQVIGFVILPRLDKDDQPVAKSIWEFLGRVAQRNVPVLQALPAFLSVLDDLSEEVASRIRSGLNSTDEATVIDAAHAVLIWVLGTGAERLPPYPQSIVDELVNHCLKRKEPGYNEVLASVLQLAKRQPEAYSRDNLNSLCLALEYLLVETETPDEVQRLMLKRTGLYQQAAKLPKRRELAAELARALEPLTVRADADASTTCAAISKWREIAASDVLPSVREAFGSELPKID